MNKYSLNNTNKKLSNSGVLLGKIKSNRKPVAIKIFPGVSEAQKEVLLRDAEILKKLSHPNLVRILDSGIDTDNHVFYVMEYLEGPLLIDLIPPDQGMSFSESWPIIQKIASAISLLHEHGILHLDLKPSNIFMIEGEPKIIDLGRLIPKEVGFFRGTPGYVAPEVILGDKATIQSDIYSFGALLAYVWTGNKLFQSDSAEHTLARQLKNLSHHINPPELAKIIQRATKMDPARRYMRITDIIKILSAYRHELEYRAQEPNEDPTQTQWGNWMMGSVLVSLVFVAAMIYFSLLNSV